MALILKTFDDIADHCREQLGVQSGDTNALNKIKRAINHYYINEIVPFKRWNWLTKHTKVIHKQFYTGGTASVTPDSTTVTLSVAPSSSIGSLTNYYFAVDGFDEVYDISAHTSESVTLTLSSAYQGVVNTEAAFAIWTDRVALPTDCREVFSMWHNRLPNPMEGRGHKEFIAIRNQGPRAQGLPTDFYVGDYFDPSGGAETEADRYRLVNIWPAYTDQSVTLSVDYAQEVSALSSDDDEPVLPLEDRNVIVYGALSELWRTIARNPEESANAYQMYQTKLARMAGKIEGGFDAPILAPKAGYLRSKRASRIGALSSRGFGGTMTGSGGSSYSAPTYLADVTINGATITGNITVSASVTIDGRDISVDGATMDAHIAATTSVHGITDTADLLTTSNTKTVTNKTLAVASNSITSTASRVGVYDSGGSLTASAITSAELTYLDDVEALTSLAMSDNQVAAADVATWTLASFDSIHILYSLSRGASNKEMGQIVLTTDGTSAGLAQGVISSLGTLGVTFTADVSAGTVRLRYTSTSTGTAPAMKYNVIKWLA
jgi:hypothetical protein